MARTKRTRRIGANGSGTSIANLLHNFPEDVVENIFALVPLKKAVTFSLLSTRFRSSWRLNRYICFDFQFYRRRCRGEFMAIVNHVLNNHIGSKIQMFKLYFDPTSVESLVESWIKWMIARGVEELDLDFSEGSESEIMMLASDLLDAKCIRVLKLVYCQLTLPQKLKGLCHLKTLILERVDVIPTLIKTIMSDCVLLESFKLVECSKIHDLEIFCLNLTKFKVLIVRNCYDINCINIDAPSLSSIHYIGYARAITFYGSMPNLNDVTISFEPARGFPYTFHASDLVGGFTDVKVLSITSTFLEGLSQKYIHGMLTETQMFLYSLKELHLFMNKFSFVNPYDIATLIKTSPFLEKVFIDFGQFSFGHSKYWELHAKNKFETCTPYFGSLRFVKLKDFKFSNLEMELVKFFLKKGSYLDTIILVLSKNDTPKYFGKDRNVYDFNFLSWKSSSTTKIEIYEHSKDRSSAHPKCARY